MEIHSYVGDDDAETGEEEEAFFSAVCADLNEHEMLQVRGVSKHNKRRVFDKSNQLADDLSTQMQRPVFVVNIKGHSVTLYCGSNDERKRKIILRSSYQEGNWELKMKAPRDHRGQIIKD